MFYSVFPVISVPKLVHVYFTVFFLICVYFSGHQTHYEQVGELSGKIEVEGHPPRQVHLRSIRDHTIGIRNWWDLYRYAIHYIYVEEVCYHIYSVLIWPFSFPKQSQKSRSILKWI